MQWNIPMTLLALAIGYALGNFANGLIVAKVYANIDIRKFGSGNAGTTNVMRTLGWLPSVLTFVGDTLKGVLGALIGYWLAGEAGMHVGGLAAIIGHNWPCVFRFRGGKGIATSLGYILVVDWRVGLLLIAVQLIMLLAFRYMSLASITSCVVYFVSACVVYEKWEWIAFAFVTAALGLFSHRSNIKRLLAGTENRLDFHKITEISKRMAKAIRNRGRKNK